MSGPLQPQEEMCGVARVAPTWATVGRSRLRAASEMTGRASAILLLHLRVPWEFLGSEIKAALIGTFERLLWPLIKTGEHPRLVSHHPLPQEM